MTVIIISILKTFAFRVFLTVFSHGFWDYNSIFQAVAKEIFFLNNKSKIPGSRFEFYWIGFFRSSAVCFFSFHFGITNQNKRDASKLIWARNWFVWRWPTVCPTVRPAASFKDYTSHIQDFPFSCFVRFLDSCIRFRFKALQIYDKKIPLSFKNSFKVYSKK